MLLIFFFPFGPFKNTSIYLCTAHSFPNKDSVIFERNIFRGPILQLNVFLIENVT